MFFLFCSSPAWNKSVAVPDLCKNRANPGPVSPFQVRESVADYFFWSSRGKGEMCMEPIVWWSRLVLKSKKTVATWVNGLKRDCPLKPVTCSVSCALGVRTTADMPNFILQTILHLIFGSTFMESRTMHMYLLLLAHTLSKIKNKMFFNLYY